jgi:NIPSNAP
MITCFLRYELQAGQETAFEVYGRKWITLINRFGGQHLGYFMPSEGASDVAYALFTFPSLAEYERYRLESAQDELCQALFKELPSLIHRYDRTFLRPVTEGLEV